MVLWRQITFTLLSFYPIFNSANLFIANCIRTVSPFFKLLQRRVTPCTLLCYFLISGLKMEMKGTSRSLVYIVISVRLERMLELDFSFDYPGDCSGVLRNGLPYSNDLCIINMPLRNKIYWICSKSISSSMHKMMKYHLWAHLMMLAFNSSGMILGRGTKGWSFLALLWHTSQMSKLHSRSP